MSFQAAVTSIAAVHLLSATPIGWLAGIEDDTPVAVWAETHGPGDDVKIELKNGRAIEVQAKKGLSRGGALWDALLALANGIHDKTIAFGVLVVAPDASGTIQNDLAKDIVKVGGGRTDGLSDIGEDFVHRLTAANLPVSTSCAHLRIQVVHALDSDRLSVDSAQDRLRLLCAIPADAASAWNALHRGAMNLIEHKGRWEVGHLQRLLSSSSIALRPGQSIAGMLQTLAGWAAEQCQFFSLPGLKKQLPLSDLLPMQTTLHDGVVNAIDPAEALERYHAAGRDAPQRRGEAFDAEFTGLFHRHSVVIAGPGLGKSTLILQLAQTYASMGVPALRVSLKSLAASMRAGASFEEALYKWGLDSAPVSVADFKAARLADFVVLADGLDDCGDQHSSIGTALAAFAKSHPNARIVVTTRPIGYETQALLHWRHYGLNAPVADKGASNLGALVKAAASANELKNSAKEIVQRELARSKASTTITSSPQLLGMAASLIATEAALPVSRAALYERMIAFLSKTSRCAGDPVSETVRQRVLAIVGWILVRDPIATTKSIIEECCNIIAPELGVTPLAASKQVESAIDFWEAGGLIERLHHSGATLMTFIHKSFAEYAAGRYLLGLLGTERKLQVEKAADDPSWSEVIGFAAGMGMGDEIAQLLVVRQSSGAHGQIKRAVALLADPDAQITDSYAAILVSAAFETAIRGDDEGLEIGMALVSLARSRPKLVGPAASQYLDGDDTVPRLVGWAAAVNAGPEWFDATALRQILAALTAEIVFPERSLLHGKIWAVGRKDRDLLQEVGLAALRMVPDREAEDLLATVLAGEAFQNVGFLSKVETELERRGLSEVRKPWGKDLKSMAWTIGKAADPWTKASRAALRAVVNALKTDTAAGGTISEAYPYVAGLLRLAGFYDVVAGDVYAWTLAYNAAAVKEALRLLAIAGAMPADVLEADALRLSSHLAAKPDNGIFGFGLPSVDLPPLAWGRIAAAKPDRELLLDALAHKSQWLVEVAASALEADPPALVDLQGRLPGAKDLELAGLAHVIASCYPSVAVETLLPVLSGPPRPGLEYVLDSLAEIDSGPSGSLLHALADVLVGKDVHVANSGAKLALKLVKRQRFADNELLQRSYEHWKIHEEPYPRSGGVVPESPRPILLEAMLLLDAINHAELIELVSDPRTDVRSLAESHLESRISATPILLRLTVDALLSHAVPPAFAAKLISKVSFAPKYVRALLTLLSDQDPRWRLVGMNLLVSPPMQPDEVYSYARTLEDDPEIEIRERVRKLLKNAPSEVAAPG
ncbi:DNA repair protein RadA [Neorhizobium galegae]|uniref:NACHT domain-containing protein n=1 Tax=Neorhizobium galegae TaxID=399 RepID=UPI0021014A71|nr:DNA repair protein RadA [Neorhizobium galegae]MCQ1573480.1 DNA repair protein RadA [Neorhizobium galegae]